MTNPLIHTIEAETPTQTWLKAARFLSTQEERTVLNLVLGVRQPTVLSAKDFHVHDLVNEFLEEHGKQPLVTTAGTIFPGGLYMQGGAQAVFSEFPALYKKFKGQWGSYAGRLLLPTIESKGQKRAPLEVLIEKLKSQSEHGHMRAAYELKVFDDVEACEVSTYDPEFDCDMTRGQPCLTHLSFKLQKDRSVSLTALYRTHFYIEKTLGNLLGLGQLLSFVATEARLSTGSLVCHSTMAQLDTAATKDGVKGWNQEDIDSLLESCEAKYVNSTRELVSA
jgi:hypothetical protein